MAIEKDVKELTDQIQATLKEIKESEVGLKELIEKKADDEKIVKLSEKQEKAEKDYTALSEQMDAIQLELKSQKLGGVKTSMFDDMKKALTDKSVQAELKNGGQRTFEIKASTIDEATELSNSALATAVIVPFREQGVGKAPDRMPTLLDLVTRGTINSNRVTWVERSARTEGTAAVAEGITYAQSDFTWIQRSQAVEKIGTFVKITNEAVEDWDQVLSEIRNELFPSVERTLESGVYSGTGVSPALQGITDTGFAAAYSLASITGVITPNIIDAIRSAVAQIRALYFTGPLTALVNPIDAALMDLPKSSDGIYLLPPFLGPDRRTVAGCRVVEAGVVTQGEILVGDMTKDALFIKRGIEIKIWDQDSTDPELDLKTITASVRAVNRIKVPDYDAFVYDDIQDILDAIGAV